MTDRERAEMYKRQLGGTNAALNRARQRIKQLEEENRKLREKVRKLEDAQRG